VIEGQSVGNRVLIGDSIKSRGGDLWHVAYDTRSGIVAVGKGGHFDGAFDAGMPGAIRPDTHVGITVFRREGEVCWVTDSQSFTIGATESDAAAIQRALAEHFKDDHVKRIKQLKEVFK